MRIEACRAELDHRRKILALLPAAVLKSRLPTGLLEAVRLQGKAVDDNQIAQLLMHVHGYDVLRELKNDLEELGAPGQWAGSAKAVAFVRKLGFPVEYAGDRNERLEADVTVLGPPDLPGLHEYQKELSCQIRQLLVDRERGMLFLPTGAGKTRVTVQALVEAILKKVVTGPVLWIAQTEELCEQAVQTWTTLWRAFGDRPMRLCRLWSENEIAQSEDDVVVVVATDAKLAIVRDDPEYDWLADPAAVVIDEAHESTGTDYTKTLAWLGFDRRTTPRPLLGLTATPFKGTQEDPNRRLANRFAKKKLDVLGDDPYGMLQNMGVLAIAEHRILEGARVSLNQDEAEVTGRTRNLPKSVLDRLGQDQPRTQRLLKDILSLPEDWPVLVFTSSVLSAQVLAALLQADGVPAAAVSGATRTQERRRSIDLFRREKIRVLTNCNVLTQGFDAPGVRALYIAKPTFSPNAYIQMVGRGLRGEKNGGKERCLIVTVADTFGQFGEELAYRRFDHLWTTNRSSQ